jgi:hypothetical protein
MIGLPRLRRWLSLAEDDSSRDELLLDLAAQALAYLSRQTGRYFGPLEYHTETLSGRGTGSLWLSEPVLLDYEPLPPVPEDPDVPEDPEWTPPALMVEIDGRMLAPDRYEVDGRTLHHLGGWRSWPWGVRNVRVSYWRGYTEETLPDDIAGAVRALLRLWASRTEGLKSETIGGYSYTVADATTDGLPPIVRDTIHAWRRVLV